MTDNQMNRLKAMIEVRPAYADIIMAIASRNLSLTELNVDRLLRDVDSQRPYSETRRSVIEFFRELEGLQLGKLVVGRHGKKTRFAWGSMSMLEFASEASGLIPIGGAAGGPDSPESPGPPEPPVGCETASVTHQYVLRPNFTVRFPLPADLTRTEAARLAQFIQSLPFDGGMENRS